MAGREPAPEELAAANVVAAALGGRWESRDGEDDPPGMHDFDVILSDGRCIALEVTSATDGAVVALSDAAVGREGRHQRWPAPGLANDWIVTIPQRPVRVAEMMSAMLPILEAFEEHGRRRCRPAHQLVVWLATPPLATPAKLWRARHSAGWQVLR